MTHRAIVTNTVSADKLHLISSANESLSNEKLHEVPQLSCQTESRVANARLLARQVYTSSQGLVLALLADVSNFDALIFPEDLDEITRSAEESFSSMVRFCQPNYCNKKTVLTSDY